MHPLYFLHRPIPADYSTTIPEDRGIIAVLYAIQQGKPDDAERLMQDITNRDATMDAAARLIAVVIAQRRQQIHIVLQLLEQLASEPLDAESRGTLMFRYGLYYRAIGDPDQALIHFFKAIEYYNQANWSLEAALSNAEIAGVLMTSGAVMEALELYLAQRSIIEAQAQETLVTLIRVNIATALQLLGNNDEALAVYYEALDSSHLSRPNRSRAKVLQNLAIVAKTKKDWPTAFSAYTEALECLGGEKFWDIRAKLIAGLADLHMLAGNTNDAFDVMRSIPIDTLDMLSATTQCSYHSILSKIHEAANRQSASDEHFNTALDIATKQNLREERMILLRERVLSDERHDPPEVQLTYHRDLLTLTDELATDARTAVSRSASVRMSLQKSLFDIERQNEVEKLNVSITAREQTISDIASALHDGVGQTITTLALKVEMLEIHGMTKLPELSTGIRSLADEVRLLAHTLSPSVLEHFGIEGALNKLADSIRSSKNVGVDCIIHGDTSLLSPAVSLTLYRSAQSVVQNALRHASPSNLEMQLVVHENEYELVVVDDGRGFVLDEFRPGIGLRDIINRVALHKGTVRVDSHPNSGTTVFINIPHEDNR